MFAVVVLCEIDYVKNCIRLVRIILGIKKNGKRDNKLSLKETRIISPDASTKE